MKAKYFVLLIFNLCWISNLFSQIPNKLNSTSVSANQVSGAIPDPIDPIPTIADRVRFLYDVSGNQVERTICINCTTNRPAVMNNDIEKQLTNEFFELDNLKLYPNPVTEDLHIDFNEPSKSVFKILVYSLSGQIVQTYSNLNNQTTITIPFTNLPQGIYIVNLEYYNGEIVDLKILKR